MEIDSIFYIYYTVMDSQNMAPYLRELDATEEGRLNSQDEKSMMDAESIPAEFLARLEHAKESEMRDLQEEISRDIQELQQSIANTPDADLEGQQASMTERLTTVLQDIFSPTDTDVHALRYRITDSGNPEYIYITPETIYTLDTTTAENLIKDFIEAHGNLVAQIDEITEMTRDALDDVQADVEGGTSDATEQPVAATETTTQEADEKSIGDHLSDAWEAMKKFDFDGVTAGIAAAFGAAGGFFGNLFNRGRKSEEGGGAFSRIGSVFRQIGNFGKKALGQVAGLFGVELAGTKPIEVAGITFPSDLDRMDAPKKPTVPQLLTGLVPDDYTNENMVHALTNEGTNARAVLLQFQNTITQGGFISHDDMREYLEPVLPELLPILITALKTDNKFKDAAFLLEQKNEAMDKDDFLDAIVDSMTVAPQYWETVRRSGSAWTGPVRASNTTMTMASLHNADSDNPTVEHLPLRSLMTKLIYDLPAVLADRTVDDVDDDNIA